MNIVTCVPSRGLVHSRTIEGILNNTNGEVIFSHGRKVPDANNYLAKEALATGADYIWFVDDDMLLPHGLIAELLASRADIALCDYPVSRTIPTVQYHGDEFLFGGLGCVLVKREALLKLEEPYFRTDKLYSYPNMTPREVNDPDNHHGLHDVDFFVRAKNAGLKIKVIKTKIGQYSAVEFPRPKGNDTAFEVEEWKL